MLDLSRIQTLAQTYHAQEMMAALVWQRRFNEFDGAEVITDLASSPELWESFLFTKPVYAPDPNGLSFNGVLETLLAMANYRPMPETSMIQFFRYPADTLYLLAENQDITVSRLLDFGKKWRADEVSVCDGGPEDEEWEFRDYIQLRLRQALWSNDMRRRDRSAVVITYWWD
ncbi:hypothetical protein IQ241_18020 [Romeria aff. gracilis LEGE 07310]|uniref:Uncharacterized protein n=1 Tax=Vasconcelosia minhoensis LEGE 07310 TaxID=915328 RepID=A0A8J7AXB3_9CYAN|nr:hypothetical protein [Romeria gracilis]MBE9079173.1 hypothetical protein [Romeria aff. gracilis LEGE 07310]